VNHVATDRLPGILGHELRNPLASAVTAVMLVRDMVDDADPRATVLDGAMRDLDRMTELIDGWLAMARDAVVSRRRLDVDELLRAVASRHGAEVIACPEHLVLDGNQSLLERALDNLCDNARKAGARHVRIAVQELDGDLQIHVEDDGCGVAAEDVNRVFAAGWSTRGGAGLGLHAVAATVAAHRGHVRCVPLSRGTRFTLTLPQSATRAATA